MMAKIWLTYAWADNEDLDIGVVVAAIEAEGVEVLLDRRQIRAGHDLWAEIEAGVKACDGWVLMVTAATLSSRPCLKELDIATASAARALGHAFPMIGLFPQPIDKSLVPGSLVGKLWLTLSSQDWASQIRGAVAGTRPAPDLGGEAVAGMAWRNGKAGLILEIWRKVGRWSPFFITLPGDEHHLLGSIHPGPRGRPPAGPICYNDTGRGTISNTVTGFRGVFIPDAITAETSAFISLQAAPSQLVFGENGGEVITWTRRP